MCNKKTVARENIIDLQNHFFSSPTAYPKEGITVMVPRDEKKLPHELKGQLLQVCSTEMRDAMRFAIAACCSDLCSTEIRQKWLEYMCSVPVTFVKLRDADANDTVDGAFQFIVQRREDIGKKFEAMRCNDVLHMSNLIHGKLNQMC